MRAVASGARVAEGKSAKHERAWCLLSIGRAGAFLLCNWVFKSKCANLKERVKWSQEVIVFMVIKASRIGEMKQRMKRSTLAINKQCFTVWSSETDEHGNNLWFENEMKHCKNVTARLAWATRRRAKSLVAVAPLKKLYERSEYLIGVQGGKSSHGWGLSERCATKQAATQRWAPNEVTASGQERKSWCGCVICKGG